MSESYRDKCFKAFKEIRDDIEKAKLKALLNEQLKEIERGPYEPTHYIDFTKKNYQEIRNPKHRLVFIAFKSNCFSVEEICSMIKVDFRTVKKIVKTYI